MPAGTSLALIPSQLSSGAGWHWNSIGYIQVDGDGAVLDGFQNTDGISVEASNVTIKNCLLNLNTSGNTLGSHSGAGIVIRNGTSNVTIQNCEIFGSGTGCDRLEVGIKSQDMVTGNRSIGNNIYHTTTGVQIDEGLIQDNYIHDFGFCNWGAPAGPDHLNGTTSNAVTGFLTIQHNTIFNDFDQTDAVSLFEDFGAQYDRLVTNNLLAGGGYAIYGGANPGGQPTHNIKITNNRIARIFHATGGSFGPLAAFDPSGADNLWSNNVWDDTSEIIP